MTTTAATTSPMPRVRTRRRPKFFRDPRITRQLVVGVAMLTAIVVFAIVGPLVVDPKMANVGATTPRLSPNLQHFLGTDTQGRDLWTVMALGVGNTLKIGLIAGFVGVGIGLVLALIAGFFGGLPDSVIRIISDSLLTVPAIAILVIIASNVQQMTIEIMALTVAALAWMFPCRTIRSQVLSIRERSYVEVARANGVGPFGLIFKEIMPNLMPFVIASFVGAVAGAMLAAIGLEALGLGAIQTQTLGVTIYWSQEYTAVLRGFWWWWGPPIVMIAFIFLALFVTSAGMDRFANPRLRRD
jgi:peptide/nickel transport system permease protein